MENQKERAVVVTTDRKGIFFGYAKDTSGDTIKLRGLRNCIYYPKEVRGFVGLAVTGPLPGSRVGPAAVSGELRGVTSVLEATPEAVRLWEEAPWK